MYVDFDLVNYDCDLKKLLLAIRVNIIMSKSICVPDLTVVWLINKLSKFGTWTKNVGTEGVGDGDLGRCFFIYFWTSKERMEVKIT